MFFSKFLWGGVKEKRLLTDQELSTLKDESKKINLERKQNPVILTTAEKSILDSIKIQVERLNVNNVTRTKAYYNFFQNYPEIHWSFLAHMVSRNGGYHMTDLKSHSLQHLLSDKERERIFLTLETANRLIFEDAYSQLLLYKLWKEDGRDYFRLLSHFSVAPFMEAVWNQTTKEMNSEFLTIALIINEQTMLETRLVPTRIFEQAKETFPFHVQEFLGTTHVLFPLLNSRQLHGLPVHQFESVKMRIEVGKKLYSILWDHKRHHIEFLTFASRVIHTGSRADYWPHIYSKTANQNQKIHSPTLNRAWGDIPALIKPKEIWSPGKSQYEWMKTRPFRINNNCTGEVSASLLGLVTLNQIASYLTRKQRKHLIQLKK